MGQRCERAEDGDQHRQDDQRDIPRDRHNAPFLLNLVFDTNQVPSHPKAEVRLALSLFPPLQLDISK
jgi:hypothetical protein